MKKTPLLVLAYGVMMFMLSYSALAVKLPVGLIRSANKTNSIFVYNNVTYRVHSLQDKNLLGELDMMNFDQPDPFTPRLTCTDVSFGWNCELTIITDESKEALKEDKSIGKLVLKDINLYSDNLYAVLDGSGYYAMERVTPDNLEWWLSMSNFDKFFYYDEGDFSFIIDRPLTFFNNTTYFQENEKFLQYYKELLLKKKHKGQKDDALECAFAGFNHSIRQYFDGGTGATWVAYATTNTWSIHGEKAHLSREFNGNPGLIQVLGIVKITEPFSAILGMYNSPIAMIQSNVDPDLPLRLSSFIFQTIRDKIKPDNRYLVLRPENDYMEKHLNSTGVKFWVSDSEKEKSKLFVPQGSHPNSSYCFIDPLTKECYNFNYTHWFCTNPYCGKGTNKSPFSLLIINGQDLIEKVRIFPYKDFLIK